MESRTNSLINTAHWGENNIIRWRIVPQWLIGDMSEGVARLWV